MKKNLPSNVLILLFILIFVENTFSQWVNSQGAEYVVGQPDFVTSNSGGGVNGLNSSSCVAIDYLHNKMYVSDGLNHRVLRYSYPLNSPFNATPEMVFGQVDFSSVMSNQGTSPSASTLHTPLKIIVYNSDLWVADAGNNRILRYNNAWNVSTNSPNADFVVGQRNLNYSTQGTSDSTFYNPVAMSIDGSGNMWVTDRLNNRILKFSNIYSQSIIAHANVVFGQTGFSAFSTPGICTQNNMWEPNDVVFIGTTMYISDTKYNRILVYRNAASLGTNPNADFVFGQSDFVTSTNGGASQGLFEPKGLATDESGRLYIADNQYHRIMIFNNANALNYNNPNASNYIAQKNNSTNQPTNAQPACEIGRVNSPAFLCYDLSKKILWCGDEGNNRITGYSYNKTQATTIRFFNFLTSQVSISWKRGNGDNCAVFIKQTNTGSCTPVANVNYIASQTWNAGSQIGTSGWYCIYNGMDTTTTVYGLTDGIDYRVMVCEYSGNLTKQTYISTLANENPRTISTKKIQNIVYTPISTKKITDIDFPIDVSATSGLTVTLASSNSGIATIVSGNVHLVGIGSCNILVDQGGDATWDPAFQTKIFLRVTAGLPTVNTLSAVNIYTTDATVTGELITNGGATATFGMCWSTSTSPTISQNSLVLGTSMQTYSANIPNLIPNTTYYLRTFAYNSTGLVYGNQISFTTITNDLKEIENEVRIYPNPTSDLLYIKTESMLENRFEIYDITGKLILIEISESNLTVLNLSNWAKGIYVLKYNQNNFPITKKIIIK